MKIVIKTIISSLYLITFVSYGQYNYSPSSWGDATATYTLGNFPNFESSGIDADVSNAQLKDAFIEAMNAWSVDSAFSFIVSNNNTSNVCASNAAKFANAPCSSAFQSSTLAITSTSYSVNTGNTIKASIVFNNGKRWSVYNGPQPPGANPRFDFRRVALHELGHALGLRHSNGSGVTFRTNDSIMTQTLGNIETLRDYDKEAIAALYGPPADSDGDGFDDVNDNCPSQFNADQSNDDGDSLGNVCDNCPNDDNEDQANFDGDSDGDVCDADIDGDGVLNAVDSNDFNNRICGIDVDTDMCDDCNSGSLNENNDGLDTDSDGACNIGDDDDDNDGVLDVDDNCPLVANPGNQTPEDVNEFCPDDLCVPIQTTSGNIATICL